MKVRCLTELLATLHVLFEHVNLYCYKEKNYNFCIYNGQVTKIFVNKCLHTKEKVLK